MQRAIRIGVIGTAAAVVTLLVITMMAPRLLGRFYLQEGDVYLFDGLRGPAAHSVVAPLEPTGWHRFSDGDSSRLAILLSDPESGWLGLAHGFRSAGIPFVITDDWQRALEHKVVLVYPLVAGSVLPPEALMGLAGHVREGGTLIGVNVLGGGLEEVFGFDRAVPGRERFRLDFNHGSPLTEDLIPGATGARIGGPGPASKGLGTHAYHGPRYTPLATYEDGTAAITHRAYSGGHAFALGFDPGVLALKAHNYRLEGVSASYANGFEPSLDVLFRLLGRIYRRGQPGAVTLRPVPWNRDLAVSITHDIDYNQSLANALEYARMEKEAGVSATYFIQTKYVRDWNDEIFFNEDTVDYVSELAAMGMEIGSHSVSHSRQFASFPLGSGREIYPDYVPYVLEQDRAYDASLLGELRVSKFLLDHFSGGPAVRSFRAGHLENPFALPQALAATGYLYDSTISANNTLSHLPYRLNYGRGTEAEVPVWEFPVTIEDEHEPPLPQRLDEAITVARRIAEHGGHYVVLIHTDSLGGKLEFERQLINALQPFSWFGSLGETGEWWRARDQVGVDVRLQTDAGFEVLLHAPDPIAGLTLELPDDVRAMTVSPDSVPAQQIGSRLVLGAFEGAVRISLGAIAG